MPDRYDALILGAGIAGTTLASILARNGVRVPLIEEGEHPKFAIGESTTPEFTLRMRLAAVRFDLPELAHLTTFYEIRRHLGTRHGVKRGFCFLDHRPGEEQDPRQAVQMPTLAPPIGPDARLYRQDVDAHYLAVAIHYRADCLQRVQVTRCDLADDGVQVQTRQHGTLRGRYLVDAGGMRSPLAAQLELRESPPRYRTRSRSIYTHFIDVQPCDRMIGQRRRHGFPYPLGQTTLHHLFAGGWLWLIPFGNHPGSSNHACSVGLLLDLDHHPAAGQGRPEEELHEVIGRYPSIARQFAHARAVRSFVGTGRLQYSSRQIVGPRWCLTAHAGAFVDPLYSSGFMVTIGTITLLAEALLPALREDDFSRERFAAVEEFVQESFSQFDRVVSASYVAFREFELYNAWFRLYAMRVLFGTLNPLRCYFKYLQTGKPDALQAIDRLPYRGVAGSGWPELQRVFQQCFAEVMAVRDEGRDPRQAARAIFSTLETVDFALPSFRLADPQHHAAGPFTSMRMLLRDLPWVLRRSPPWMRDELGDWSLLTPFLYGCKALLPAVGRSAWRAADPLLDSFFNWRHHG